MTTPYVCPTCPQELVETEEGNVYGFYGVLVSREGVPMTGGNNSRALVCPNDSTPLVPSRPGMTYTNVPQG